MKYLFNSVLVLLIFLFACDNNEEGEEAGVESDKIAIFEVTGMVCKMGCGGEIRKALYETKKVDYVDVNFEEDAPSNKIEVHYSSQAISIDDIKNLISAINEGQFTAEFLEEKIKSKESACTHQLDQTDTEQKSIYKTDNSSFKLPNITELLNSLIY